MAKSTTTTKKTTSKKAPVKPATTVKQTTTRKATAKRTVSKRAAVKPRSFKLAKETQPFTSFKVTEQTVYWLIFTGAVLLLCLWILKINMQVQELYDQIDQNRISQMEIDERYNKLREAKSVDN